MACLVTREIGIEGCEGLEREEIQIREPRMGRDIAAWGGGVSLDAGG